MSGFAAKAWLLLSDLHAGGQLLVDLAPRV